MKTKPFYGWWVTVAAICTFGIAVGIPYYNMPFFYDYYEKAAAQGGFGWSRDQITLGFPLAALFTLWVGPLLVHRFSPRKLILIGTALTSLAFLGFSRMSGDITAYYATLGNERPHGGRFDYRSILTDLLAWVMERAAGARFADLVANELWGPMGAEGDAEVTVDGHGNAMADGGICCTLRDLARFGLLLLRGGRRGSAQVIPREWIHDTLTADPETVDAFAAAPDVAEFPVGAYYRNQFWVVDPRGPIIMASGINGQTVLVHGPADVVIAKFSTWPVAWTPDFGVTTRTGLMDLAERVAG